MGLVEWRAELARAALLKLPDGRADTPSERWHGAGRGMGVRCQEYAC
jgi:hypothetical protein